MKKALIIDLDNTIYPVSSIADEAFGPVISLIDNDPDLNEQAKAGAKYDLLRRPFQHLAQDHGFSNDLTRNGIDILKNYAYNGPIKPFDDYSYLQAIKLDKFLVTTGFSKFQHSKVDQLGIRNEFKAVYVVDPEESDKTKKDIFRQIMEQNNYTAADVLIIGDDPKSEIQAGRELNIDTFLYDPEDNHPDAVTTYRGNHMQQVSNIINA